MHYPRVLKLINYRIAYVGGIFLFCIAGLTVFEALRRAIFTTSTMWILDVTLYLLIWAVFLGTSYAMQEHAHIAVDFVKTGLCKLLGRYSNKAITIIGYVCVLVFVLVIFRFLFSFIIPAVRNNTMSYGTFQIPIAFLYSAIAVGMVMLLITTVFIILDILSGSDEYL